MKEGPTLNRINKVKAFLDEYNELCKKHGLCIVSVGEDGEHKAAVPYKGERDSLVVDEDSQYYYDREDYDHAIVIDSKKRILQGKSMAWMREHFHAKVGWPKWTPEDRNGYEVKKKEAQDLQEYFWLARPAELKVYDEA